jgi:hypothetical protein
MQQHQIKSTGNVLRWLTLTTILLGAINLTGCASFGFGPREKPIEVVSKPVEKTPLAIPLPDPLRLQSMEWVVVTPENVDEVFQRLQNKEDDLVLFGLTDEGYKQLAVTIAELRNLINLQRNIIIRYKEYYEPNVK